MFSYIWLLTCPPSPAGTPAPDAESTVKVHGSTLLLLPPASLHFLPAKHLNMVLWAAAFTVQ